MVIGKKVIFFILQNFPYWPSVFAHCSFLINWQNNVLFRRIFHQSLFGETPLRFTKTAFFEMSLFCNYLRLSSKSTSKFESEKDNSLKSFSKVSFWDQGAQVWLLSLSVQVAQVFAIIYMNENRAHERNTNNGWRITDKWMAFLRQFYF